mmetsp:Transcript_3356/g.9368  ORF Transcript_3356/g.9368 Transcript_3356/m.9368 type:complete len:209 (-) Transcript_3356:1479-2105(-)|eukprot:361231-Chlamydomonas_euryale.AAC.3
MPEDGAGRQQNRRTCCRACGAGRPGGAASVSSKGPPSARKLSRTCPRVLPAGPPPLVASLGASWMLPRSFLTASAAEAAGTCTAVGWAAMEGATRSAKRHRRMRHCRCSAWMRDSRMGMPSKLPGRAHGRCRRHHPRRVAASCSSSAGVSGEPASCSPRGGLSVEALVGGQGVVSIGLGVGSGGAISTPSCTTAALFAPDATGLCSFA